MRAQAIMLLWFVGLHCGCRQFGEVPPAQVSAPRTTPVLLQEVPDRVLAAYLRLHPRAVLERVEARRLDEKVQTYCFHFRDASGIGREVVFDPNGNLATDTGRPRP